MDLAEWIEGQIKGLCHDLSQELETAYREPLIGFARASDPIFEDIRTSIDDAYQRPSELLEGAKTAVAFFIPFALEIIDANREEKQYAMPPWVTAYYETNRIMEEIVHILQARLKAKGITSAAVEPTGNFDRERLISFWSHKHTAYAAGLGCFGFHHQLITPSGCGGRFVSFVMDEEILPTPRVQEEYCLKMKGMDCGFCIQICPMGALTEEGLDRIRCSMVQLKRGETFKKLGLPSEACDICGKCGTGPCGAGVPKN